MTDTPWDDYAVYFATFLVVRASALAHRNIHFSVLDNRKPLPFPTHWSAHGSSGVSFQRDDLVPAIEWVATALLANYGVCWRWTKTGGGSVWHITNDIGDHVRWDMLEYLHRLRHRRIDLKLFDLLSPDDDKARAAHAQRRKAYRQAADRR